MEPTYSMQAEQAAEALMASMKLNGIDRFWFTSGSELAFFQEVPVKHQALGRPTPTIMTMSGYPPSAESGSVPGARDAGIHWFQQVRDQGELVRQYMRWDHKLASYDNPGTVVTRAVQVMPSITWHHISSAKTRDLSRPTWRCSRHCGGRRRVEWCSRRSVRSRTRCST